MRRTGSPFAMLVPQSPRTKRNVQVANCDGSGRSRPSAVRWSARCSAVLLGPSMISTGSPGTRCKSRNVSTTTPQMTAIPAARRCPSLASIGGDLPRPPARPQKAHLLRAAPLLTALPLAKQVQRYVLLTTLARYDSTLVPQPYLARAWRWSPDRHTLTFTLRTDVRSEEHTSELQS